MKKGPVFLMVFLMVFYNFCFADIVIPVTPLPQSVEEKGFEVKLDNSCTIDVDSKNEENVFAARYFSNKIKNLFNLNLGLNYGERKVGKGINIIVANDLSGISQARASEIKSKIGDEGYYLDVENDRVAIFANSSKGVFYAFVTLSQLLQEKHGAIILRAVRITDYPRIKMRVAHVGIRLDNAKEMLDTMASLKFNTVIMESRDYFHLDENNNQEKIKQVFDYARKLHITPIPELQSFGYAAWQLEIDPRAAEGVWVRDAHFKFVKNQALPLKPADSPLTNVIRALDSNVVITSLDKTKCYREDFDYQLVGGQVSYPFPETALPLEIKRIPNGTIREGEEVLVSYDYVTGKFTNGVCFPYCPSSSITYKIMENAIKSVVYSVKPEFISIGHDDIMGLNRDSRCQKRRLTNAELLAEDINRLYGIIKSFDLDLKLLVWDDMFNPFHSGKKQFEIQYGGVSGETSLALDLIPRDIIFMIWWYDENDYAYIMENSPRYFNSKGFNYLVAGFKNKINISNWANIARSQKNCLGIVVTTWDGWKNNLDGIEYTVKVSW